LAFLQAQHSNSFWPGLLEKAYAKWVFHSVAGYKMRVTCLLKLKSS
jgi:hypothetical protein